MPQVLPMTRVEAYLAYKAGVISEADLKPSLKTNFYSGLEHWLAYWCGLCDDYPVDENNDPKWYTEEEYYVAYLCGIAPDYPVNCYRRVGAYLRHIISLAWPEPEKPLTREEYYLSLIESTYKSSGDPSSNITIDRTAQAPFKDLKIYGDSFQQTYSGKNLLNNYLTGVTRASGATMSSLDTGVRITADNGGSYRWGAIIIGTTEDLAGKTLTLSANLAGSEANVLTRLLVGICNSDISSRTVVSGDLNTSGSVNVTIPSDPPSDKTHVYVMGYAAGATSVGVGAYADYTNLQVEIGPATDYEPYVGGIPAPNPDYPQDIKVVTGEQTVKVTGKNLFNYLTRTFPYTVSGITATLSEDGTITVTGIPTSDYIYITPYTDITDLLDDGETYCLSATTNNRDFYLEVVAAKVGGGGANYYGTSSAGATHTFTVDKATYSSYKIHAITSTMESWGGEEKTISERFQLEKGSIASSFETYKEQTYPLSLGSLELAKIGDYQDYIWTDGEKWYKHAEVGKVNMTDITDWYRSTDNHYIRINFASVYNAASGAGLCNIFIEGGTVWTVNHFSIAESGNLWVGLGEGIASVENFIAWLSNHNAVLYYAFTTPTDEEITNATLISQLNALLEGGSYDPQTNIIVTATDPNLPGLLQVQVAQGK